MAKPLPNPEVSRSTLIAFCDATSHACNFAEQIGVMLDLMAKADNDHHRHALLEAARTIVGTYDNILADFRTEAVSVTRGLIQ